MARGRPGISFQDHVTKELGGAVIARNETCHDVKADLIRSLLCASGFYKRWRYFNRRRAGSSRLLNFFDVIFDLWNPAVTNSTNFSFLQIWINKVLLIIDNRIVFWILKKKFFRVKFNFRVECEFQNSKRTYKFRLNIEHVQQHDYSN